MSTCYYDKCYCIVDKWDCVAACYFMDTAHNIIEYLEHIYYILKPGGYWVNFGEYIQLLTSWHYNRMLHMYDYRIKEYYLFLLVWLTLRHLLILTTCCGNIKWWARLLLLVCGRDVVSLMPLSWNTVKLFHNASLNPMYLLCCRLNWLQPIALL